MNSIHQSKASTLGGSRPSILILSSSDELALDVAKEMQAALEYNCKPTIWTQDVFIPGHSAYNSFVKAVDDHAYGIFLMMPDDMLESRGERYEVPRMNVIFELGYFAAKHGIERAFLLTPRGRKITYLSDLDGIQPVNFDLERFRSGEQAAAIGSSVRAIENAIKNDRLQYPAKVHDCTNILSSIDTCLNTKYKYCLAVTLGSGESIKLRICGTSRTTDQDLSSAWGMPSSPAANAWDHSRGIVDGTQDFWAKGPVKAFIPFMVNESCAQLDIYVYENAQSSDPLKGKPSKIITHHIAQ